MRFMSLLRLRDPAPSILCQALDHLDRARNRRLVEQIRSCVSQLMHGAVELIRSAGRVDRIAERDLVRDDEDALLRTVEELLERAGIPAGGGVERFAPPGRGRANRGLLPPAGGLQRASLALPAVRCVAGRA